jgi:uncharacterized protein (TIGR01777 family)
MENVLITGGTGTIGMALSRLLADHGYRIRHLSRTTDKDAEFRTFKWSPSAGKMDIAALDQVDHIIHLAGAGVGDKRWTDSRKKIILDSRIETTNLILKHVKEENLRLKSFISASGISYYGSRTTEHIYKETDSAGTDFLADVSVKWEEAAEQFSSVADRVAMVRTGVVLSQTGGAMEKLIKPIKMGIGSPLGSGKQYVPWIHIKDINGIYLHLLQNDQIGGPINAVASEHVNNAELTQAMAKQLGKKLWAPKVPGFMLKLLFGEMSIIILEGSRIGNTLIKEKGYQFQFDQLNQAAADLL